MHPTGPFFLLRVTQDLLVLVARQDLQVPQVLKAQLDLLVLMAPMEAPDLLAQQVLVAPLDLLAQPDPQGQPEDLVLLPQAQDQ